MPKQPQSINELMSTANSLAGMTFGEVAHLLNISVPKDLKHAKGWVGQLIELYLGASAGSRAQPDFPNLGIELKTIPVNEEGKPLETTFVCVAPLVGIENLTWEKSHIKQKLSNVLWIPIQGSRNIDLKDRQIGFPFLWQPTTTQENQLKQDWNEIMEKIALGEINSISAQTGQYLQLRPKAANSKAKTQAIGTSGELIYALPRGFYLKTCFTKLILQDVFN